MSLDNRIYGLDETAFAKSVSRAALGAPGGADKHGSDTDGRAHSDGGEANDDINDATVQIGARDHGRNDSRAQSEGNHGKQG